MSVQFITKAFVIRGIIKSRQILGFKEIFKNHAHTQSVNGNFCTLSSESPAAEKLDDSKAVKKSSEQYFQDLLLIHHPELLEAKISNVSKDQVVTNQSSSENRFKNIPNEQFRPSVVSPVRDDGVTNSQEMSNLENVSVAADESRTKVHQRESSADNEFNKPSSESVEEVHSSVASSEQPIESKCVEDMSDREISESIISKSQNNHVEQLSVNESPDSDGILTENDASGSNNFPSKTVNYKRSKRLHRAVTEDELIVPNLPDFEQPLSSEPNLEFVDHVAPITVKSFNIAPFVDKSETLQQLVKLGVDLSKLEKSVELAEFYIKADFEKDMQEHIFFLHRNGVTSELLGDFISRNPKIFMQHLDDLQVRINYLESKKFDADSIARIITKAPLMLSLHTKKVDGVLGFYQKTFELSGSEVRYLIVKYPKLIVWPVSEIKHTRFIIKEVMGFNLDEMKTILLQKPKIWTLSRNHLKQRFDYIHNKIRIPHEVIVQNPGCLLRRKFLIGQRHQYLLKLGKAQYDPKEPRYISIENAFCTSDSFFCTEIAKTSVQDFNEFLKTL